MPPSLAFSQILANVEMKTHAKAGRNDRNARLANAFS